MGHYLLTGATGLLGSHLLGDLALAGIPVAVLVRGKRGETARQRTEAALARWDRQVGYALPRPVVLEGSLSDGRFGLNDEQLDWVRSHCSAIIQNAASVTYHGKTRDDEPWKTNVSGTKNALEFCERTGIREYHHVSTAYVCGQRDGRVYEHELDLGQTLNTDYERSKLEGEQLVRAATHIAKPTIYRVAIIIGDSRTGYTPTFHGFYVPLKLVHTMFKRIVFDNFQVAPLQEAIRIQGHERKNLVPVDWVSHVMTHILRHPQHHGQTYHLAPERPVVTSVMRDSMVQSFLQFGDLSAGADPQAETWSFDYEEFKKYFRDQMAIYESYWKDDPVFDLTNLQKAAPHLPCPEVDAAMLTRLCRYAIETNFGWPRPAPIELPTNLDHWLPTAWRYPGPRLGLRVTGPGGGDWELCLEDGRIVAAVPGLNGGVNGAGDLRLHLNTHTFQSLADEQITLDEALRTARVVVEGKNLNHDAADVLRQIVHRAERPLAGSAPGATGS